MYIYIYIYGILVYIHILTLEVTWVGSHEAMPFYIIV